MGNIATSEDTAEPVPAPWRLEGSGLLLLLKTSAAARDPRWHAMSGTDELARSGLGLLMFVDYQRSDAGPYRELLFIPGQFQCGQRRAWSVTRILVSSQASVAGGRANWGIPKELGKFRLSGEPGDSLELGVSQDGQPVADIAWHSRGPALPVTTAVVPKALRTLIQILDGKQFQLVPSASGRIGAARVDRLETNPALFPALDLRRVVAALSVPRFKMTFPVADISPWLR
ncbi:MAG: acetoacetate decarboxylase family protein [Gammaproteobacteria bacterium]